MNKIDMRIIHSIINGEVPGARKTLFFLLTAIFIWGIGMYYSSSTTRMEQTYKFQQGRLVTLNELAVQYKQLSGERSNIIKTAREDIIPVFSQIIEEAKLRDRLSQISTMSRGISVVMNELYAEDLVTILNGLIKHGIRVTTSELRAMPAQQNKRLFSFSATLEVEN